VSTKETFKQGITQQANWEWQGKATYTLRNGYIWLWGDWT